MGARKTNVPKKSGKNDVDAEADYHGHTAEQMLLALHFKLGAWRGFQRVRVIHGQGEVLKSALENWSREVGIAFHPEPNNPGSTILLPAQRTLPQPKLPNTLAASGLQMTPEQQAALHDPVALEQERQRQKKLRAELERRRLANEAAQKAQKQREAAMWENEMARLDKLDKSRPKNKRGDADGPKPLPPVVVPPAVIKYEEGYWRSEIVRVGDTDTETLQKQKRTGLDKLAPPMEAKPKTAEASEPPTKKSAPKRETAEDAALFEAEMRRLMEG